MLAQPSALPVADPRREAAPYSEDTTMQFDVQLATGRIDLAAVEQQLQSQDPAAIADFDVLSRKLRISTALEEGDIASGLSRAGIVVSESAIERQPSTCCGGCGG